MEEIKGALDHIWLIICGAMVMFMQAGFAMVESGCCRAKNVQNILLKNLTDVCIGTIGWWISGWAIAYGGPMKDGLLENGFMGTEQWFGIGFVNYAGDGKFEPSTNMLNWFFQWAFCSAAATIVSGGVAERVNFGGYCLYSFAMTAFVYPVIVAWTWGYGWLASINSVGFMDFAGSGVVHMTGGVGALMGAIIAGPRAGRFQNPDEFGPHSLPLITMGTFILWFGWYGFNCGSTLGMNSIGQGFMAAHVAMNTTIAAATAGLTVFVLRLVMTKGKYDIGGFCNGILAGLVSITAPCGNVECGSAFAIALIGAFVYQGSSSLLKKLKVDDPIDAFAVHGACGAWGVMAAALFDWGEGFDLHHGWSGFACTADDSGACISGGNGDGFAANLLEVIMITLWSGFWTALIFLPLRFSGFLRVSDEDQDAGLDAVKHSPSKAYSIEINSTAVTTGIALEKVHPEKPGMLGNEESPLPPSTEA
ncbi:AMT1-1 [Symbiodinium natans]|uniref:Ammonium transporter n=1 Tax=Symbiodinium natans TaxID=878477 RepID=A0A812NGE2_9DINO|nr:AMT1-1 [Symbiodinium natans]